MLKLKNLQISILSPNFFDNLYVHTRLVQWYLLKLFSTSLNFQKFIVIQALLVGACETAFSNEHIPLDTFTHYNKFSLPNYSHTKKTTSMDTSFPLVIYLTHRIPVCLSTSAGRIPKRLEWNPQSTTQTASLWYQWRRSAWTSCWVECGWRGRGWGARHTHSGVSCRQLLSHWSTDLAADQCHTGQCWWRQRGTFPAWWKRRLWYNWDRRDSRWSCSAPDRTPVRGNKFSDYLSCSRISMMWIQELCLP